MLIELFVAGLIGSVGGFIVGIAFWQKRTILGYKNGYKDGYDDGWKDNKS